jgi:hypothetical protein
MSQSPAQSCPYHRIPKWLAFWARIADFKSMQRMCLMVVFLRSTASRALVVFAIVEAQLSSISLGSCVDDQRC